MSNFDKYFKYEEARDNLSHSEAAEMAAELWDMGAHLVMIVKGAKRPMGSRWNKERHSREAIVHWVNEGNLIGVYKPAETLGISAVDIDHGIDYLQTAIDVLGEPLAVHESSRSVEGKCHAWYKTTSTHSTREKWEGGDLRGAAKYQIILYNIPAVYDVMMNLDDEDQDVDIDLLPASKMVIGTPDTTHDEFKDVPDDDAVVDTHRHSTMISKISRAVNQCDRKMQLNQRFKVIVSAHREAFEGDKDQERVKSIKREIEGAKAFMEGAWTKKQLFTKLKAGLNGYINASVSFESAQNYIESVATDYQKECVAKGLPTPDTCYADVINYAKDQWAKKEIRESLKEQQQIARSEAIESHNAKERQKLAQDGNAKFMVESAWGTIESWREAADAIGFGFRYNDFSERGEVWIPKVIDDKGGRWVDINENNNSLIVRTIEKNAYALTTSQTSPEKKGVYLHKHKEMQARNSLLNDNTYCPMKSYFNSLPKWCGEPVMGTSMERGGMRIDAGEFTTAVQEFMWLFIVRNCLFPGSSVREYIALYGAPDCGKSKFVELALPIHLRQYYNGAFQLDGSLKVKLERSMGKALMECGEFGQGGKKDWNAVKQWLTLSDVNGERLAYKEFAKSHKLTATTVFTTNHRELPPSDEGVLSRFIWATVLTPADRKIGNKDGERIELVWTHFDELYDPSRPDLGTWRQQYFAEALVRVQEGVETTTWEEDGETHTAQICTPRWLPAGSKSRLIEHNRNAGATYCTEQSENISLIIDAIEMLEGEYETPIDEGDTWFPNAEIKAAMWAVSEGEKFDSYWSIKDSANEITREQKVRAIRTMIEDHQMGNAISIAAEKMGVKVTPVRRRWKAAKGDKARGYAFERVYNKQTD